MLFKKNKNVKYSDILIPIIVFILLLGLLFAVIASLQLVSQTNKKNFAYTAKIRATIEEIDKIFEQAEVNLNAMSEVVKGSYNISKTYDEKYNVDYLKKNELLVRTMLKNSPGVNGVWLQLNTGTPFASKAYIWYGFKNNRIINLNAELAKKHLATRKLTPANDPYYFQALKTKNGTWSDLYFDADTKTQMLTLSQPIYKNGVLIGVSGVDLSVANLQQVLKNMQAMLEYSEMFLLDANQNIIISQLLDNRKLNNANHAFLDLFNQKKSQNDALVEYKDNGIKKTAIKLQLSNNYNLVMTFPNSVVFKGFSSLFGIMYFILVALAIVALINLFNRYKMLKLNTNLQNDKTLLRSVIEGSPNVIALKDLDGAYIDCNQSFLDFVGLRKEECIGKTAEDLFKGVELDEIIKAELLVKETKASVVNESCYVKKNGETIYQEKHVEPLFSSDNELDRIFILGIDITKRRLEQNHLETVKEAAEKATSMKSNFLANMSHEIRTPLNGVLGFLQLLEDTNPTEEQSEFIKDAEKSSELLLTIINEILDFSKIEAGKLKIDRLSFDIRSVVEDVTIMNTSNACKKGLDINSLICSDVPQKVFGDPGRLKQILNNLVGNALKFTQEGEVVIYVNQLLENDENAILTFRVKDTGIGISKDKLKLIFESFAQADASTTRRYGGTGLGLAISQKLAELMSGDINVESNLNEGSTFTLTIPFKKDSKSTHVVNSSLESLSGKTILVIENNATDLKIIRYYLNEASCIIKEARTIEETMNVLNKDATISAILVDSKMENSSEAGLSSLIKSNERTKDIPMILYTSLAKKGDANQAKSKGFVGFLTKPLKKLELIDTLSFAINDKDKLIHGEIITKHLIKEHKFSEKAKILMVEDTELNCKFMTSLLSRVGLTCDIAYEGRGAIEAIKNKKYDLILMDCQMPIMDGFEATIEIRNLEGESAHTPIIAMTANAMQSDRDKCHQVGMDDYISKPINTKELLSVMSKYLPLETEEITVAEKNETADDTEDSYVNRIIEEMVEEIGFSKDEATQLFKEFLDFLPQTITELETALEKNDFEELKRVSHKLKGASANLRIETISKLGAQLEKESPNQDSEFCRNIIIQIKTHQELLRNEFNINNGKEIII